MQLVTLSIRPAVLTETWTYMNHFAPWIDSLVVVTPSASATSFESLRATFREPTALTIITDEELTGLSSSALSALDHQSRNATLRRALAVHPQVAHTFIMSDDDSRPLKPVERAFFGTDDVDRRFYFYDLTAWPGRSTDFDEGQHVTAELLGYIGCERLAYASHMPQIIRKAFFAEAWDRIAELTDSMVVCEWAVYFNIASDLHPDAFAEPEPFRTLAWPMFAGEFPLWVRPPEYVFENHYPHLYDERGLFSGLPTALDVDHAERHSVEKILRWSSFGRRAAALDFPDSIDNPWVQNSAIRRVSFRALRRLRQAYEYVAMEDRARLSELSGQVGRLGDDQRRQQR